MGIAATTPALPTTVSHSSWILEKPSAESSNLMSQDYQQGIFSFSNGLFERSAITQHPPQIRRDNKVRLQGFEGATPPLVGIEEEEPGGGGGLPVYETAGMLSEMFNFPPGGAMAAELLEQPSRPQAEWYGSRQGMMMSGLGDSKNQNHPHNHSQISTINADSAAAMQLFLMNPQTRSPSPPHTHQTPSTATCNSTLHMLLPNPSANSLQGFSGSAAGGGSFGQFTWVPPDSAQAGGSNNPGEIGGVVESQGLSLSLSSSLQHLEAAKAEELRMGDGGFLYYNQGHGGPSSSSSSAHQFAYKGVLGSPHQQALHLQGAIGQNQQVHVGFGSSLGVVHVLRNSKYVKAAQELLEEFCSVGRGQFKKTKFSRQNSNPNSNLGGGGGGGSSSSSKSKEPPPPLSAADRIEHQRRKVKLVSMLDEACKLPFSLFLFSSHLLSSIKSQGPPISFSSYLFTPLT